MKKLLAVLLLLLVVAGVAGYIVFISPNVNTDKRVAVKIPTGSTYDDVLRILNENKVLKNEQTFGLVSKLKNYPAHINPGYYFFNKGLNNRQIVNILRAGLQSPVKLVIYNIRTKDEFAGLVGRTLEMDSNMVLAKLNSPEFCKTLGSDTSKILARFIVDNYEFYWNISFDKFVERMTGAYKKFWNEERQNKAHELNLSPTEVTVLASITEKEVIRDKELPTVAGVYLNRLKIGMPLQADPTLVFALRDFNAQRVTSYHKDFDTPYNTYKYAGLPPGPICMPRKKSIDAVLNFEEHQ
ncbi:MAG: endolytic transglycosylase MltG, partial [Chitinophagales bacterium]|nr:endolytic transglycosylase MltG [Chitinophagales bacterium]